MFRNITSFLAFIVLVFASAIGMAFADSPLPEVPDDCDYADAVLHDGWGWNEKTSESCEPIPDFTIDYYVSLYEATEFDATYEEIIALIRVDYCDYGNAHLHNGFGWNGVLMESCPPLEVSESPLVVAEIPVRFEQFPLHTVVDSNGTIYSFQPPTNSLAALNQDGVELWKTPLNRPVFISDIVLAPEEDLLIVSSLGGKHGAFYIDGTAKWLVDVEGTSAPPTIVVTESNVVVHYEPDRTSSLQPFIASYDHEGVQQWKYQSDLQIDEFTLGHDGLIYVLLTVQSTGDKRYVLLEP